MASSFAYGTPTMVGPDWEEPSCPHCGKTIQEGDNVHWYDSTLWHTKPCP